MPWVPSREDIRRECEYADKVKRESRRDQFAAAALTGLLAGRIGDYISPGQIAEDAWNYAEAMLRERPEVK